MFSRSGDSKWLNVFQPSNTEVVDSKASIATSLFLKTFSLQGKQAKGKQEPCLYVKYICRFVLKGKKRESISSTVGRDRLQCDRARLSVIWFLNLPKENMSLADKPLNIR